MEKIIKQISKEIKKAEKIALFHHKSIDGDSFSSSYGLLLAIKEKFPSKHVVFVADVEDLDNVSRLVDIDMEHIVTEIDESYLTIVGDVGDKSRIFAYSEFAKGKFKICFDHHQYKVTEDTVEHDIYWSEPDYNASAMQAIMIAEAIGVRHTEETAFNLCVGLLTDTGIFKYSMAKPLPVRMYSEMLEFISDKKMEQFFIRWNTRSRNDLNNKKTILGNLEFNESVALSYLSIHDLPNQKDLGRKYVNEIGNIKNFPVWVIMREQIKEGTDELWLKLSFRSNGPNINKVAVKYGGGGHIKASGAYACMRDGLKEEILADLNNAVKEYEL